MSIIAVITFPNFMTENISQSMRYYTQYTIKRVVENLRGTFVRMDLGYNYSKYLPYH